MHILRSGADATARLQVISGRDIGAVAGALRAAEPEIESLAPADVPAIVMDSYLIPGSCLLPVDFEAATPPDARAQVPGILARHPAETGSSRRKSALTPDRRPLRTSAGVYARGGKTRVLVDRVAAGSGRKAR